eukprot:jgi/Botrbrau1/1524/Bobra.0107s0012.1
MSSRTQRVVRLAVVVGLLAAAVALAFKLGIKDKLHDGLKWVDKHKIPGVGVVIASYIVGTSLLLPESALALGAGLVFGLFPGVLIIWTAAMITIGVCFHIGRYVLADWVKDAAKSNNIWDAIELVMRRQGWQIVILLHLAPFVPFNIMNYVMGATDIAFSTYLLASAVGTIPGIMGFVYLGSIAADLPSIIHGDVGPSRAWQIVIITASVLFTLAALGLLTFYAKRELERQLHEKHVEDDPESRDPGPSAWPHEGQFGSSAVASSYSGGAHGTHVPRRSATPAEVLRQHPREQDGLLRGETPKTKPRDVPSSRLDVGLDEPSEIESQEGGDLVGSLRKPLLSMSLRHDELTERVQAAHWEDGKAGHSHLRIKLPSSS